MSRHYLEASTMAFWEAASAVRAYRAQRHEWFERTELGRELGRQVIAGAAVNIIRSFSRARSLPKLALRSAHLLAGQVQLIREEADDCA